LSELSLKVNPTNVKFGLRPHFRQGSKVQGPMNSSNLIGWKL
jgi:hypothetical protein